MENFIFLRSDAFLYFAYFFISVVICKQGKLHENEATQYSGNDNCHELS